MTSLPIISFNLWNYYLLIFSTIKKDIHKSFQTTTWEELFCMLHHGKVFCAGNHAIFLLTTISSLEIFVELGFCLTISCESENIHLEISLICQSALEILDNRYFENDSKCVNNELIV